MTDNLVEVSDLVKQFPVKGGALQRQIATVDAVDGVNLEIRKGEAVGLVGESGCGKTTLGRMLVRLLEPTSGTITFDGADITHLKQKQLKPFRRRVQIIFQDPYSSLDPRTQVGESISEGTQAARRRQPQGTARPGAQHARARRPRFQRWPIATRTSSRAASASASGSRAP